MSAGPVPAPARVVVTLAALIAANALVPVAHAAAVDVVASSFTLGPGADGGGAPVACNQDPNTTCDPGFEPNTGAAYDTTITTSAGTYTFNGWRDVLRVLLAGFDHDAGSDYANRDCESPVRRALASSWGNFFENQCAASAGEAAGINSKGIPCTGLRHVFRPDDFSTAAGTLVSLLDLPSVVNPETTVTVTTLGGDGGLTTTTLIQHTGATPFCNAVRPSFVFPTSSLQPQCLAGDSGNPTSAGRTGQDATWDPTTLCPNPAAPAGTCSNGPSGARVNAAGCTRERGVFVSTMQDNDPIRVPCAGSGRPGRWQEDVCSHSGDLGLVLPMNDVPEPNSGNVAREPTANNTQRYNPVDCGFTFTAAPIPDIYDAVTQAKVTTRVPSGEVLCPDGDFPTNTGACLPPAASSSAECLGLRTSIGRGLKQLNIGVPLIHPVTATLGDGREWSQHLYTQFGTSAEYQENAFAARPLPMTGAFYRLHARRSLNPVTGRTCQEANMTDQIGCLVEASPCSLGVADPGAVDDAAQNGNVNSSAVKLQAISPLPQCIAGGTYPPP